MSYPTELICGVDEVGRGCLAGPMIAVAALFKGWDTGVPGVDDSKKLTPQKRDKLFPMILWSPFLIDFGVGQVEVDEINQCGITWANSMVFYRAVEALPMRPNYLVVDGVNGVRGWNGTNQLVETKADGKYPVVGAASILAKVIRDRHMMELHDSFPQYGWDQNKGYGSKHHTDALKVNGHCRHHRLQFLRKIIPQQTGWSV